MSWFKRTIPDTIFTRLLSAFCKMGIVILTARYFGTEGRGFIGILAYAMTFLMLLNEFVGGSSIITLVPTNSIKNLLVPSYVWALIVCVLGYLVLPLFPEVPIDLHPHIFGLSLLLAFVTINYSILIGKQKIQWQNWSSLSIVLANLVFLFVSLVLLHKTDVFYYIYGMYLGEGIGFILSLYLLFKFFGKELKGRVKVASDLFKLGILSQTGHLIQFFNYRLSYIFILEYMSQSALGLYSTVFVLPETIWIFGNSIGTVLHMKVVNRKSIQESIKMTWKYTLLSIVLTVCMILLVTLVPSSFWPWLLGGEFTDVKSLFYWLIPGTIALGVSTCISHYYHAVKRFVVLIYASSVGLAIKGSILLYFSSALSLEIVAQASSLGLVGVSIFLLLKFYIETNNQKA